MGLQLRPSGRETELAYTNGMVDRFPLYFLNVTIRTADHEIVDVKDLEVIVSPFVSVPILGSRFLSRFRVEVDHGRLRLFEHYPSPKE